MGNNVDIGVVSLAMAENMKKMGFNGETEYFYQTKDVPYVKQGLKRVKDSGKMNHNIYDDFICSAPLIEDAFHWSMDMLLTEVDNYGFAIYRKECIEVLSKDFHFYLDKSGVHGEGIFAKRFLSSGMIVNCDIELIDFDTPYLKDYQYPWDRNNSSVCMGFGGFLNHSNNPNIKILKIDKLRRIKYFKLLKDINKGEEVFSYYSDKFENNISKK